MAQSVSVLSKENCEMKLIDTGGCICDYVMLSIVLVNTPTFLINVVQLSRKIFHSSESRDL